MTVIYGIRNPSAQLLWYNHLEEAADKWANNGKGKPLKSTGWDIFDPTPKHKKGEYVAVKHVLVCSNSNELIYGVTPGGELHWYKNLGELDGSVNWHPNSGCLVRDDWGGVVQLLGGGGGVLYTKLQDGTLKWWKHNGSHDGSNSWHPKSGTVVGTGWNNIHAFSALNGLIYGVNSIDNGLYWYKHEGYFGDVGGKNPDWHKKWANGGKGKKIGTGWNADFNFCGPEGQIYSWDLGTGVLMWYKHIGYKTGTNKWMNKSGIPVGHGWNALVTGFGVIEPGPRKIKPPGHH